MKPDSTDTTANAIGSLPLGHELHVLAEAAATDYPVAALDEFPEGASEFADEPSRRRFLALMGASLALAGATGCNLRPASQRKIVPYTVQPDEITPGVPLFFASSAPLAGYGQGVLVRSNEGRPTKVEGNPDNPSSLGGASVHALASVLGLYDPDRSRSVTRFGLPTNYEEAIIALRGKLFNEASPRTNVTLRILTETVTSPTLAGQISQLLTAFPQARWVQYQPVDNENAKAGVKAAFGNPQHLTYDFLKADVVVSLEADFLCSGPGSVRYSRDFADRRKIRQDGKDAAELAAGRKPGQRFKEGVKFDPKADPKDSLVNRMYAVECMPTNTGAVADHQLSLTTEQIGAFARSLAANVGVTGVAPATNLPQAAQDWLKPLAADLTDPKRKGKTIVIAGDHLPAWVHSIVAAINVQLGNIGQTVHVTAPVEATVPGKVIDFKTLVGELTHKQVDVLLILGGDTNPAYTAPADVDFAGVFQKNAEEKTKLSKKADESGLNSLTPDEQRSLAYLNNFLTFHLGAYQDETGVLCEWHVPEAHYLETWGDIRGHDGTVAIQQPLIAPLHGGKSAIELLVALLKPTEAGVPGSSRDPLDIVKATWKGWFTSQKKTGPFEIFWQESVRKGAIDGTALPAEAKVGLAANWTANIPAPTAGTPAGDYELNFRADPTLYDGRFANNGWLQEVPKPLTKISWDNAAFMSPKTGAKLGFNKDFRWTGGEHGRAEVSVIEIDVGGKKVKAPAWVLPGHADDAITVHLGSGRAEGRGGRVANAEGSMNFDNRNASGVLTRGFNAYVLRTSTAPWTVAAKASKTNRTYFLACTQGRWVMIERDPTSGRLLDRRPVRYGDLAEYKKNPLFAKITPMASGETELINENVPQPVKPGEKVPLPSPEGDHFGGDKSGHGNGEHSRLTPLNMYRPAENLSPDLREGQRRRWAMAIDLSACTGCSACVVACQSENNTPVVGKEQVTKGREMYWISIDRYYGGTQNDPKASETYFQPRMCVQCENAPCEIVCPVGATVHSSDGLNDMTYNRCVGTRYCSNNCPYKVRRFNFITFQDWETDTIKLGRNPDVSVRSRGVMEKCTFCVQRIRYAEIVAEREQRGIKDGEILTACQAACPSGAIVFGDINDANATVSKWKNEPASYGLLAELNTRPRLTHMAVIRNPNPAMPK